MSPFLKARLKKVANYLGIRQRLGKPINRDMNAICKQLSSLGFAPSTILDVGVADGTVDLYKWFPNSELVLIEPVRDFEPAIRQIFKKYRGKVIWAAAGAENGVLHLSVGKELGDMHNASFDDTGNLEIAVRRLDDIGLADTGPYLLKVDVEGHELDVIKGAAGIISRVEVAILETRLFNVTGSIPIMHEVVAHMAALGFVVYDIIDKIARPIDGAMILCDIVYVKANSPLRRDVRFASEQQIANNESKFTSRIRRRFKV